MPSEQKSSGLSTRIYSTIATDQSDGPTSRHAAAEHPYLAEQNQPLDVGSARKMLGNDQF